MLDTIYKKIKDFKKRYPMTISWRLKSHSKVAAEHVNDDEEVLYAFAAQKLPSVFNITSTYAIVVTDKRILLAQKRLIFGYFYYTITPDMFNDLTLKMGLFWGKIVIDTIKEKVYLTFISKIALREIETVLSKYMMQEKRQYESELTDEEHNKLKKELKEISKYGEK